MLLSNKNTILASILIFCTVCNVVFGIFVLNYAWFHAPRNRPINTLLLIDQVKRKIKVFIKTKNSFSHFQGGRLVTCTLIAALAIISFIFETPLAEIFGNDVCQCLLVASLLYYALVSLSGFNMAVYRLVIVKCSPKVM